MCCTNAHNGKRADKIRLVLWSLERQGHLNRVLQGQPRTGVLSRIAEHFGVTRQRVSQIVKEEGLQR